MSVDSLGELRTAFRSWRRKKRHERERIPEPLMVRARRAAQVHGPSAVSEATSVCRSRLAERCGGLESGKVSASTPAYSRIELPSPPSAAKAAVEVETPAGVKVRVFELTAESMGILTALCGTGGAR